MLAFDVVLEVFFKVILKDVPDVVLVLTSSWTSTEVMGSSLVWLIDPQNFLPFAVKLVKTLDFNL